nr:hypothetical protein GCM10020093_076480 [Planobispora longispora]
MPTADGRELMVSVYYPATAGGGAVPYMTVDEAGLLLKGLKLDAAFKAEQLSGVRVNARAGAPPAGGGHPWWCSHRASRSTAPR